MPVRHARVSGLPANPANPTFIQPPDWDAALLGTNAHAHDGIGVDSGGVLTDYATDAEAQAYASSAVATHAAAGDPHPTYETSAEAAAKVTAHEGAADPHPTYLTAAEGDAAYRPIGYIPSHASTTGQTANDHHAQLHHAAHEPGGGDAMAVDAAAAIGSLRTLGAGAAQAAAGNHVHGGAVSFTTVEKSLGAAPNARRAGSFQITGLSGLTPGKPVHLMQAVGPYTGKGTRLDEAEMDRITCSAQVLDATTIQVYWTSQYRVRGNYKFDYLVSA